MRISDWSSDVCSSDLWSIAADHLDQVSRYEAGRAREAPVRVELLSSRPIEQLVGADAVTWLDRELVADTSEPLRESGFGAAVRDAQARRRQWLIAQGFAVETNGAVRYRSDMLPPLQRRELLRNAGQLTDDLGMGFVETCHGGTIVGVPRRPGGLPRGPCGAIAKGE